MYRIVCDSDILYDPRLPDMQVVEPVLRQVKNEPGELTFSIPKQHAGYASVEKLKSRVKVYRDNTLIWKGRVLSDERDLHETKQISAEGALAFLVDSVMRPFTFDGTAADFFAQIIAVHNAQVNVNQQFTVGDVTVRDTISRSSTDYLPCWQTITEKLLDALGGYLVIRFDSDENCVIDYLAEVPDTATQRIEFGENLIDLAISRSAEETYTACIPLGAPLREVDPNNDSDERLTIASVNDGNDYLVDTALAAEYGVIFAPISLTIWEDVTMPTHLMTRGQTWLAQTGTRFKQTIKLSAVDLHNADADVEAFAFLDSVIVSCGALCAEEEYLLADISIPLDDPARTSIVLGDARPSLIVDDVRNANAIKDRVETIEADYATNGDIREVVQEQISQNTSILQSAQQIILAALEDYVRTQDFTAFQSSLTTTLSVMAGTIEANFTEATSRITTLDGETSQEFESIRSFIRLIASGIVIGKSTSAIKLKLENDILYFFSGGEDGVTTDNAIAYFSAGKLYVNDVQILNSLRIGAFAWVPESNNLNFKLIGG